MTQYQTIWDFLCMLTSTIQRFNFTVPVWHKRSDIRISLYKQMHHLWCGATITKIIAEMLHKKWSIRKVYICSFSIFRKFLLNKKMFQGNQKKMMKIEYCRNSNADMQNRCFLRYHILTKTKNVNWKMNISSFVWLSIMSTLKKYREFKV